MSSSPQALFFEKQRYNLRWLWLIYIMLGAPLLLMVIYSSYGQLFVTDPYYSRPEASQWVLYSLNSATLLLLLAAPFLIHSLVLKIWIYPELVRVKLGVWYRREISLEDIQEVEALTFDPVRQFTERVRQKRAWLEKKQNTYSVRGRRAVKLVLKNGMEVLLGTQRPEEMEKILKPLVQEQRT
ncbi:hypothetical protein [Nafulsella turpanensis]|uniref:hypothetical protein n=1 Tax=Nafulsella turpanensis TaxID=1265690 RepID=UPI0003622E2B|nr:hypothetical protein [Nafulsella turpanensis]